MAEMKTTDKNQIAGSIVGELCFTLLPFVVLSIIYADNGKLAELLREPAWSLAASVLFGQSIIKLIHGVIEQANVGKNVRQHNVGAIISIVILIGLVPSLICLTLNYGHEYLPLWLMIFQILLFALSIFVFCMSTYIFTKTN